MRGDGSKEVTRKCVVIVSFLVFLTALSLLFYNMIYLSLRNAELNGEIQRIAHSVDDGETTPEKKKDDTINWDKLLKINDEIVGWIQMKDTHMTTPFFGIRQTAHRNSITLTTTTRMSGTASEAYL